MSDATRPDIPAVPTVAAEPSGAESPDQPPAGRSVTTTEPAGGVHRPGPRRMVSRQMAAPDCLSCGQRWPCEGSWQARAEAAEARLAGVRSVLLEGGQGDATARCRAIVIVGTEGES